MTFGPLAETGGNTEIGPVVFDIALIEFSGVGRIEFEPKGNLHGKIASAWRMIFVGHGETGDGVGGILFKPLQVLRDEELGVVSSILSVE